MRQRLALTMICDHLTAIMRNQYEIPGAEAVAEEHNDDVILHLHFDAPGTFLNHSKFEHFTKAVQETADGMARAAELREDYDEEAPPVIQFDSEYGVLYAPDPRDYAEFLDQFSRRQGLFLEVPLTELTGMNGGSLSDEFRARAEAALKDPAILKMLDSGQSYQGRDGLYRAVLAAQRHAETGQKRPLYSVEDIRGAFRAENRRGSGVHGPALPTFWIH